MPFLRSYHCFCLVVAAMAVLLFMPATASAEPVGYSVSVGKLLSVDVETGDTEIIGDTGLESTSITGLTTSLSGELYGVTWAPNSYELVTIDKKNGLATILGTLEIDDYPTGLSFDPRGRLWMTTEDALYLVDSGTGAVTLWAPLEREVESLAVRWKKAFVFTRDIEQGRWLEQIDLDTGELTPLWNLDHLEVFVMGATFDRDGTLWFLASRPGPLSVIPMGFFRMPDLTTGDVEETFFTGYFFTEPEAGMSNLAIRQWRKVIESRF